MSKSEVYSWRLTPELKAELEAAARAEKVSISDLLERMVQEWLGIHKSDQASGGRGSENDPRRKALMDCAGIVRSEAPSATNAVVREEMGVALSVKHARSRPG